MNDLDYDSLSWSVDRRGKTTVIINKLEENIRSAVANPYRLMQANYVYDSIRNCLEISVFGTVELIIENKLCETKE